MEPITLIVTALAAGASSGAIEGLAGAAKENAKAVLEKLHSLVQRRFDGNAGAQAILTGHQNDPATYEAPLTMKLAEAGAADDSELLDTAVALLKLLDQDDVSAGKYNVMVKDSKGVQIGNRNSQVNKF